MTQQQDMHKAVDVICDAWPEAQEDDTSVLRGHGYDAQRQPVGDHGDPTGNAAIRPNKASAWIIELRQLAYMYLDAPLPHTPSQLRRQWHRVLNEHQTGWSPQAVARLYNLANNALAWWPHDKVKPGQVVNGVTVGERGNDVEVCGLCKQPAPSGRDDNGQALLRRINGQAFHAAGKGCYWKVWRDRLKTG